MNPAKVKTVTFDLDDTLFDRKKAQMIMAVMYLGKFPVLFADISPEQAEKAFLKADETSASNFSAKCDIFAARRAKTQIFLEMLGIPQDKALELTMFYVETYPHLNLPIDHAHSTLMALRQRGYNIGIISNGFSDVQFDKIHTLEVTNFLLRGKTSIFLSSLLGVEKPDPGIFKLAAAMLHSTASQCLHVGDDYYKDVVGAHAAGFQTCWFNPEQKRPNELKPDLTITSLDELLTPLGQSPFPLTGSSPGFKKLFE